VRHIGEQGGKLSVARLFRIRCVWRRVAGRHFCYSLQSLLGV